MDLRTLTKSASTGPISYQPAYTSPAGPTTTRGPCTLPKLAATVFMVIGLPQVAPLSVERCTWIESVVNPPSKVT